MTRTVRAELVLQAKDKTGRAFSQLSTRLDRVDRQSDRVGRRHGAASRRLAAIGSAAAAVSAAAGAAALAAGAASVNAASDMENALFEIRKKSGASQEQLAVLRTEINDLAAELPVSIAEIAAAYERGAAAGIPLGELREFAKLSNQVADSWDGVDAAGVANYFAGFRDVLKIPQPELETFADLINGLADSGISDEGDIAQFIDRVGASLLNFGMTPKEIAAYGAALNDLKISSEIGARAMDTLVGKIGAPENLSEKSYNALQKIVGSVKEFNKLTGNDKLMAFFDQLEKMTGQQRISLLGALMGEGFDDEVTRMVAGVDRIREQLRYANDENNYKGTIAGLSEEKLQLFDSKLQVMNNSFETLGNTIGQNLTGPLGQAMSFITDINREVAKHLGNENDAAAGVAKSKDKFGVDRAELLDQFEAEWERETGKTVWTPGDAIFGPGTAGDFKAAFDQLMGDWNRSGSDLSPVDYYRQQRQAGEDLAVRVDRENLQLGRPGRGSRPKSKEKASLDDEVLSGQTRTPKHRDRPSISLPTSSQREYASQLGEYGAGLAAAADTIREAIDKIAAREKGEQSAIDITAGVNRGTVVPGATVYSSNPNALDEHESIALRAADNNSGFNLDSFLGPAGDRIEDGGARAGEALQQGGRDAAGHINQAAASMSRGVPLGVVDSTQPHRTHPSSGADLGTSLDAGRNIDTLLGPNVESLIAPLKGGAQDMADGGNRAGESLEQGGRNAAGQIGQAAASLNQAATALAESGRTAARAIAAARPAGGGGPRPQVSGNTGRQGADAGMAKVN